MPGRNGSPGESGGALSSEEGLPEAAVDAGAADGWAGEILVLARGSLLRGLRVGSGLLLALPTSAILVRSLGIRGYGVLAFVLGVVTAAGGVASFGMGPGVTRLTAFDGRDRDVPWPRLGMRVTLVTGGLATLVLWAVVPLVDPAARPTLVVAAPLGLILATRSAIGGPLAARRRIPLLEGVEAGRRVFYAGVAISLAAAGLATPTGIAAAYVLVSAAAVLALAPAWRALSAFGERLTRLQLRALIAFSAPLFVAGVSVTVLQRSDVILLGVLRGPLATGLYAPVLRVADLSVMVVGVLMAYFMPTATRLVARKDYRGLQAIYATTGKWGVVLAAPLLSVLLVTPGPLLSALFGPAYAGAGGIARVLALGYSVNVLAGVNGATLVALGKSRAIGIRSVVAVVANLAINAVLIPRWGALGAAVGTSIVYTGLNVANSYLVWRSSGVYVHRRDVLAVAGAVTGSAVVAAALVEALGWNGSLRACILVFAMVGVAGLASGVAFATQGERRAVRSLLRFKPSDATEVTPAA